MPKLTIQLVTWNSAKYLPLCLESIFNQTYRDWQVLVIDNNSLDETVPFIKQNYPQVAVFGNRQNNFFAKAHNQGLKLLRSEYVLITNPDIVLEPDFLTSLMTTAEQHQNFGSFGGKLLRLIWQDLELGVSQKTKIIDSLGLRINRHRSIIERGLLEEDRGQYDKPCSIFGVSAALALYRRQALETVKIMMPDGTIEYFDEDFALYQEDVDLAWRLQKANWPALIMPTAVAYHFRGSKKDYTDAPRSLKKIITERKNRRQNNYFSYKNHLLLLLKNETLATYCSDFLRITWYELKKFTYLLFFETTTLRALSSALRQAPRIWQKRKFIITKVKASEIRKQWFK